jgi:hypothetical protein
VRHHTSLEVGGAAAPPARAPAPPARQRHPPVPQPGLGAAARPGQRGAGPHGAAGPAQRHHGVDVRVAEPREQEPRRRQQRRGAARHPAGLPRRRRRRRGGSGSRCCPAAAGTQAGHPEAPRRRAQAQVAPPRPVRLDAVARLRHEAGHGLRAVQGGRTRDRQLLARRWWCRRTGLWTGAARRGVGGAGGWMVIYYVLYCHRRAAWEAQLICGWKWRCQVNVCSRDVISGYVNVTARLEFFLAGGRYAGVARVEKVLLGGSWFFLWSRQTFTVSSLSKVRVGGQTDGQNRPWGPSVSYSVRKGSWKPNQGEGGGEDRAEQDSTGLRVFADKTAYGLTLTRDFQSTWAGRGRWIPPPAQSNPGLVGLQI